LHLADRQCLPVPAPGAVPSALPCPPRERSACRSYVSHQGIPIPSSPAIKPQPFEIVGGPARHPRCLDVVPFSRAGLKGKPGATLCGAAGGCVSPFRVRSTLQPPQACFRIPFPAPVPKAGHTCSLLHTSGIQPTQCSRARRDPTQPRRQHSRSSRSRLAPVPSRLKGMPRLTIIRGSIFSFFRPSS
jgi:hypothetical protein